MSQQRQNMCANVVTVLSVASLTRTPGGAAMNRGHSLREGAQDRAMTDATPGGRSARPAWTFDPGAMVYLSDREQCSVSTHISGSEATASKASRCRAASAARRLVKPMIRPGEGVSAPIRWQVWRQVFLHSKWTRDGDYTVLLDLPSGSRPLRGRRGDCCQFGGGTTMAEVTPLLTRQTASPIRSRSSGSPSRRSSEWVTVPPRRRECGRPDPRLR